MDKNFSKLSADLEKERLEKVDWKLGQLAKMESSFQNKQEQIVKNKDNVISTLQSALDESIGDVVAMKTTLAKTVRAIPQKIVLRDELKDLATYQPYKTMDFTSDELDRYGNYQVVNA